MPRRALKGEVQYLYSIGDDYTFMDVDTYDQTTIPKETIGEGILYLKENMNAHIMTYEGRVIGLSYLLLWSWRLSRLTLASKGILPPEVEAGHSGNRGGRQGAPVRQRRRCVENRH